ncbi:MAG: Nif3-like dinuclear metal center hexameric protein [Flavobacteriaceae bacterium]
MKIHQIIQILEEWAPLHYAEDFDNVGLLVGNPKDEVGGVLVTHDCLEEVVDEAIERNCNLIVCFHPILFKGLKRFTGNSHVVRAVRKAIKNDVVIYAIHTALDNQAYGVSFGLSQALGLTNTSVLLPKENTLKKLNYYVPKAQAEHVRNALFAAGAGKLGNYDECSFSSGGEGSFRPSQNSTPYVGKKGERHIEDELQIQMVFQKHLASQIIEALLSCHPYEEVAYEITSIENSNPNLGMGMIGDLPKSMKPSSFLDFVKKTLGTPTLRHSHLGANTIERVAVLGGSGSFAIQAAKSKKADAYITADLKYHDFYEGNQRFLLVDAGHYETEQHTKKLILNHLTEKLPNFAILLSEVDTNPIKYL